MGRRFSIQAKNIIGKLWENLEREYVLGIYLSFIMLASTHLILLLDNPKNWLVYLIFCGTAVSILSCMVARVDLNFYLTFASVFNKDYLMFKEELL